MGEKKVKSVYLASPYTKGDVAVNVKAQIDAASQLRDKGFIPFWPLHSHFEHMAHPKPYQVWLDADLYWITKCDCLLRLPGESAGADIEVEYAKANNIPVYFSIEEL